MHCIQHFNSPSLQQPYRPPRARLTTWALALDLRLRPIVVQHISERLHPCEAGFSRRLLSGDLIRPPAVVIDPRHPLPATRARPVQFNEVKVTRIDSVVIVKRRQYEGREMEAGPPLVHRIPPSVWQ